ncbi:B12-binding domain-containing radical SAM protein [Magnetovirga frankeli]|uniref:B12-binding domain-containing radical SAM protein n=1 Tax=Magnetovirga frankeli TaxID=947516 RepID=UPI001293DF95|nr:B12-binding domain-containing radical SAM protein [gamma proteobacterium SS-5]
MNVLLVSCKKLDWMQESKGAIPLPLLYLASVLKSKGHEPIILDLSVKARYTENYNNMDALRDIDAAIQQHDPSLIGFNCFVSQQFPFIMQAAEHIKTYTDIHITLGGAHPSLFPVEILEHCPAIDTVVIGEGETQIIDIINSIEKNNVHVLSSTQALAWRSDSKVIKNDRVGFIKDLDSIPMPSWDLINLEDYYGDHTGWHNPKGFDIKVSIPILTSRSCPFSCNFCACFTTMGRMFRVRSPYKVVDEIEYLNKEFGMNYFGFIDDIVNIRKDHIIGICNEIIRRKLDIQFEPTCGLYLGKVDDDIAKAMARAGCTFARLPVEHGSDWIRTNVIGKKISRESIFKAQKVLKANGIRTSTMSIMGFPEDTVETLQETYDLLIELNADLNYVFNLIPMPGSRVFEQAVNEGLLNVNFDINSLWRGDVELDPVQKDQQFYIKPKDMTFEEMAMFRQKFNQIRILSDEIKEEISKSNETNKPSHSSLINDLANGVESQVESGMILQAGR